MWYNRFKEDGGNVNNDACPGLLSTSKIDENIEAVKKILLDNRGIAIREVSNDVGKSLDLCQAIITEVLGMKRVAAKIVPKLLNFGQKQSGKVTFNDDPDLLKNLITRHCLGDVDEVQ